MYLLWFSIFGRYRFGPKISSPSWTVVVVVTCDIAPYKFGLTRQYISKSIYMHKIKTRNRLRIVPKLSEASLTLFKSKDFFPVFSCSGVTALARSVIYIYCLFLFCCCKRSRPRCFYIHNTVNPSIPVLGIYCIYNIYTVGCFKKNQSCFNCSLPWLISGCLG